jgi:tetratricopeptide (TPR) repeat protein
MCVGKKGIRFICNKPAQDTVIKNNAQAEAEAQKTFRDTQEQIGRSNAEAQAAADEANGDLQAAHDAEVRKRVLRSNRPNVWLSHAGMSKNHLGHWEQAAAWCRRAIEANRNYQRAYFLLTVSLAQLGRLDEARSTVKTGLALNPTYTISRACALSAVVSDDPTYLAQLEPIFDGLRKAGLPEE